MAVSFCIGVCRSKDDLKNTCSFCAKVQSSGALEFDGLRPEAELNLVCFSKTPLTTSLGPYCSYTTSAVRWCRSSSIPRRNATATHAMPLSERLRTDGFTEKQNRSIRRPLAESLQQHEIHRENPRDQQTHMPQYLLAY